MKKRGSERAGGAHAHVEEICAVGHGLSGGARAIHSGRSSKGLSGRRGSFVCRASMAGEREEGLALAVRLTDRPAAWRGGEES